MRVPSLLFALVLSLPSRAETVSPLWAVGRAVLPQPQQVSLAGGEVRFGPDWSLAIGEGIPKTDVAVETLQEDLQSKLDLHPAQNGRGGMVVSLEMKAGSVAPGRAADADQAAIAAQAYRLQISEGAVTVSANAPEGLFYGVETFMATC